MLRTLESSSAIHETELVTEEQKLSEAGRLQVICQTKIFAEMVAAYEDFRALCHAIATRRDFVVLARIGDYAELGGGEAFHGVSYPRTQEFMEDMMRLALLAHALEGFAIGLLIDEAAAVSVAFHPAVGLRVVGLRALPHCTTARIVPSGRVLGHVESTSMSDG